MFDNIKTKITGIITGKKSMTLTSPELSDFFRGLYTAMFTPGQPIYTEMTVSKAVREAYEIAIPVYRGIRAIIQAGSGIPWVVNDSRGKIIQGHPFATVWANPNPEFSGQDNMEFIIAHLILCGNGYLRPIYVNRQPREFWVEMPDLIQPIPSSNRNKWIDGYQYTNPANSQKVTVAKETFIHFKQLDPGNLYTGTGAIQAGGRTIDTFNEGIDTQKVSMQNRGMPSGMMSPEEAMTPEQFDDFKRKFKDNYLDKNNRREPWLFPRKVNWIEMSNTPVEMDYTNSQRELIRQIAAAIGVDPWWVGDREHSTYNNVGEARKSLYEDVVIPILDDIKATLNLKVRPMYGDNIQIGYDVSNVAALREDFGKKTEQASKLWTMGVPFKQINEKLELGFNKFSGWDNSYLPFSVAPVGSSGQVEQVQDDNNADNDNTDQTGGKSFKTEITEEFKTAEWKRIDSRRVAYWGLLQKKFEPLYEKLGKDVADAATGDSGAINAAISKQSVEWKKTLSAVYLALIEDFGGQVEKSMPSLSERKFDPFSAYVKKWVSENAAAKVKTILDTQKEEMARLIQQGVDDNLTNAQISKSIRQFYTERASFFAQRVARTETAAAAGFGQHSAARDNGFGKKIWLSSRDARTRDSHLSIDGEERDMNERYSNGLMYPGDPSGDPAETIQCRCVEIYKR